jgi:hypothetical protein
MHMNTSVREPPSMERLIVVHTSALKRVVPVSLALKLRMASRGIATCTISLLDGTNALLQVALITHREKTTTTVT